MCSDYGYVYSSITPERELIEQTARWIADHNLSDIAEVLITGYGTTGLLGNMAFLQFYPFAVAFLRQHEPELAELMMLDARKNSRLITERVKELKAERERQKHLAKTYASPIKSDQKSSWKDLSSFLSRLFGRLRKNSRKQRKAYLFFVNKISIRKRWDRMYISAA